eukprot:1798290-Alexandrium_andersonii.AAC.1
MATPRRCPGPPSSDLTAAMSRRGSMAHGTPARSPSAPPSLAIRTVLDAARGRQAGKPSTRCEGGGRVAGE